MCWVLEEGSRLHTQCPQLVHSIDEVNRAAQRGPGNSPWEQVMFTGGAILEKPFQAQRAAQAAEACWGNWRRVSSVSRGDQTSPFATSKHRTSQKKKKERLILGIDLIGRLEEDT